MGRIELSKKFASIQHHQKLSTRDLRDNLAEALKFASGDEGKLVLTKNGEEKAALVSLKDLMILDALDDLRIKDVLNGKFDKKVFWSVLKERLNEKGKEGANSTRHGRTRSKT